MLWLAKDLAGAEELLAAEGPFGEQVSPWPRGFLFSPALTVGGGTTQVLKNVVAERLLGLPLDIDVDGPPSTARRIRERSFACWARSRCRCRCATSSSTGSASRKGHRVIDVVRQRRGDVRGLPRVRTGGVVGADLSAAMVVEARRRAPAALSARFVAADAHRLPFGDGSFDRCRVERTLQHVSGPRRAVCEMARVLRPGGRLVSMEPDWGWMMVDHPDRDLTAAVCRVVAAGIRNPWVGRELAGMLASAGLADVDALCIRVRSGFVWFRMSRQIQDAVLQGDLERARVDGWPADGKVTEREGRFVAVTPVFIVGGTRSCSATGCGSSATRTLRSGPPAAARPRRGDP